MTQATLEAPVIEAEELSTADLIDLQHRHGRPAVSGMTFQQRNSLKRKLKRAESAPVQAGGLFIRLFESLPQMLRVFFCGQPF